MSVGNIRKGALPGSKQKRCIFRCMCCQVLTCMCNYALPGARRKRCRAVGNIRKRCTARFKAEKVHF